MPTFLAGGMVYASIIGYVRQFHENITPYVTAASTFGTAIGYLVGLLIVDFPGINATFMLALAILLLLIWNPRLYIGLPILIVLLIFSYIVDMDNWVEQIRSEDNNVYAKMVGGTVIDYDWSRFQKSEYVISGEGDNEKIYVTLNGAMQVMASKNDRQIRNIGYETLYQTDYVKDKKVLIIGSGMGRGVQLAIRNGASHVDCVDIEPSLKVKYDLYKNYVGDIYSNKKVNYYVMDGRVALNKLSDNKYDLVVFEGVISAYAVHSLNITTEGYLCTAEAVNNALNMLEDNGVFLDYTISSEKTINSFVSAK